MTEKIKNLLINDLNQILLVIDYDRTLVNNDKEIMDVTKKQLIKFQAQGGQILLASGRPLSGLKRACLELELMQYNGYVIAENGANVYDIASNTLLASDLIDELKLKKAFKTLTNIPVKKGIYTKDSLVVSAITNDLKDEAKSNGLTIKLLKDSNDIKPSSKIVISDPLGNTHDYYKQIKDNLESSFNVVKSSPRYIEITNKTVDKAVGINFIVNHQISEDKLIIGIGDSQNDYTMLQACDYKIAMGNASEEIKQLCDITIATNQEDAIGKFLQEML